MNDDFNNLIASIKTEYAIFDQARRQKDIELVIRQCATIAGIIGSMRAIVAYSEEGEISNPEMVDNADRILQEKIFPAMISLYR